MAYIQASGGGANKPFKEFDDLTYVTTGLSTNSCSILSGGYCEIGTNVELWIYCKYKLA